MEGQIYFFYELQFCPTNTKDKIATAYDDKKDSLITFLFKINLF